MVDKHELGLKKNHVKIGRRYEISNVKILKVPSQYKSEKGKNQTTRKSK